MVRRDLPPATRLFSRKRSIGGRVAGSLALILAVAVLGFGIATALYLDQPSRALMLRAPALAALLPKPPGPPPQLAALPPPAALPAIEPQAGSSAPSPTAAPEPADAAPPAPVIAALPALPPVAAPPAIAGRASRHYWVEYGVFAGKTYARRLEQSLKGQGLPAVVVATHDPRGRRLLRVRSAPLANLAAARAAAAKAGEALHLAALIHSGSPAAAPEPRYRVQFAAFAKARPAARLSRALRRRGITASVYVTRGIAGKPLFYVRSQRVRDHRQALALGARGRSLITGDFLVEEVPQTKHAARAPPRPATDRR
jgi:cell division septation protein DedD